MKDFTTKESKLRSFKDTQQSSEFTCTKEFASQIKDTDNYYVIITREDLMCLSYSIHSILELKSSKLDGFIYTEFKEA